MAGRLTTYLGTAPGVGKTYAMLGDARLRSDSGQRVVVGWIERHGRSETSDQGSDLEMIEPMTTTYRDHEFAELDTDAVISARPDLAVVDELAHSWPDGSRKRWMDVANLLDAGIDVFTSLNVANLLSARDYVARITGAGSVESVPDDIIRSGDVVLIDLPPDALRRRLASGKVFSAEQVGGALGQYFQTSNLEALSELGRAWVSGNLEEVADDLLSRRGLAPLVQHPVVVAGVSGSSWGETVILRASELAAENKSDLLVVHANLADGTPSRHPELLAYYRQLTEGIDGTYVEVDGESAAGALAEQTKTRDVAAFVVARHRSRLGETLRGSVARRLRRMVPGVPVEEVTERAETANGPDA